MHDWGRGRDSLSRKKKDKKSRQIRSLVLLLILISIICSACSIPPLWHEKGSQETQVQTESGQGTTQTEEEASSETVILPQVMLSEKTYEVYLTELVRQGKTADTTQFLTTGLLAEEVTEILNHSSKYQNPYLQYYLKQVDYQIDWENYGTATYISVTVALTCYEDCVPVSQVQEVTGYGQAYEAMKATFRTGFEKTALYVPSAELAKAQIINMMEQIAWNSGEALPLLFKKINYQSFDAPDGSYLLLVSLDYASYGITQADQLQAQQLVKDEVNQIAEQVKAQSDDPQEQCRILYDKILEKVSFDYQLSSDLDNVATSNDKEIGCRRGIYGALIDGASVCSGYASAFQAVCDQLGIPCLVVTGYAEQSDHAWNAVILDGQVRYLDPTWGDSAKWHDTYLFMSAETIQKEDRKIYDYFYVPPAFQNAGFAFDTAPANLYDTEK